MGEIVRGQIINTDERGLVISAPIPDIERFIKRRYETVLVELEDGRRISPEQRRKAYALINEIADWQGDIPDAIKRITKIDFMTDNMKSLCNKIFSLSDCDVTTAREYITYLIDFILRWDVPTKVPLYELCDDLERYVYATLVNKKCAVCGRKGELHHAPPLGMGMDRKEAPQLGMTAICLCREHHNQAHAEGQAFLEAMHLAPVPIDEKIARVHKFTKKARRSANE